MQLLLIWVMKKRERERERERKREREEEEEEEEETCFLMVQGPTDMPRACTDTGTAFSARGLSLIGRLLVWVSPSFGWSLPVG